MFSFSNVASLKREREIELLVVGNKITEERNLGFMKKGEENTIEPTIEMAVAMSIILRFVHINNSNCVESKRLFSLGVSIDANGLSVF